jgi:hypothetical protein
MNSADPILAAELAMWEIEDSILDGQPSPTEFESYEREVPREVVESYVAHHLAAIDPERASSYAALREQRDVAAAAYEEAWARIQKVTDAEIEAFVSEVLGDEVTTDTSVPSAPGRELIHVPQPSALDHLRAELATIDKRLPALVVGAYKNGGQGADYGLVLAGVGDVALGPADWLLQPRKVRAAILDAANIAIRLPSNDRWGEVVEVLCAAAEIRDVSITDSEVTREWLASFLDLGYHSTGVNLADAEHLHDILGSDPGALTDTEGRVHIRLPALLRYIERALGTRGVTARQLAQRLGALGFVKRQLSARPAGGGAPAKLRVWQSPPNFDPQG